MITVRGILIEVSIFFLRLSIGIKKFVPFIHKITSNGEDDWCDDKKHMINEMRDIWWLEKMANRVVSV
jgi:hypothetical protein